MHTFWLLTHTFPKQTPQKECDQIHTDTMIYTLGTEHA